MSRTILKFLVWASGWILVPSMEMGNTGEKQGKDIISLL